RLNEPHTVWSAGIGLAAIHLALTNWLKSVQASVAGPSSLMSNTLGAAAVAAWATLALPAGAAGVSAGSCLPHAVSASAALTASASGLRRVLVMRIASIGGSPLGVAWIPDGRRSTAVAMPIDARPNVMGQTVSKVRGGRAGRHAKGPRIRMRGPGS